MSVELPLEDDGQPIDASKLRALLRRKYPGDQFAMLYEVRDAAGFAARRSADVMVIGLWPSRGCMVEGMELKVSRSDWLRELKKPQKAEAFFPYCDRWWIIAANKDVVRLEELPQTWGLMIPRAGGMGILRQAPDLKPEPVDRYLLAAMMKRATDTAADSPEVQARIEARVTAAHRRWLRKYASPPERDMGHGDEVPLWRALERLQSYERRRAKAEAQKDGR